MSQSYTIDSTDKFGQMCAFDLGGEAAAAVPWFNQTLTTVNDSVVRLGVVEGEFHWHRHTGEDEFFLVLQGELHIDLEGRDAVVLRPLEAITISRGVMHRPRAPYRTVILMVEPRTVVPTGDACGPATSVPSA